MNRSNAYGLSALLAIIMWAFAVANTVNQTDNATLIGQGVKWLVIAFASSLPLALVAISALMPRREEAAEPEGPAAH